MQFKSFAVLTALVSTVIASPLVPREAAASASAAGVAAAPTGTATDIWDFPDGTWVENLAVRSNGQILTTLLTTPQVYQVDPTKKTAATLVHTFTPFKGCLGITELGTDIFYVVVGNVTYQTFPNTAGSFSVWKLDMTKFVIGKTPATVTEVATFPQSSIFNGITSISSSSPILLIADSGAGAVWSLNTQTGATAKVDSDKLMAPTSTPPVGINGLKVRSSTLYFTSTQQQIFASAPINSAGTETSAAKALNTGLAGPDDFTFDASGNAYIAGNDEVRYRAASNGAISAVSTDPLIVGSTATQFGRTAADSNALYVTTHGPISQYQTGTFTAPGRVVKLTLSGGGY